MNKEKTWSIDLTIKTYESDQIKEITDSIFRRLKRKRLDVGANLVGIDSHVKEMILWLHMESSDVRIVGIYRVGGIGKTTIAQAIYNKLSCEFDCMSFLENISEKFNTQGYPLLQNQLLGDILEGEGSQKISSVAHKAIMIEAILLAKRAFIVLDDVDNVDQLEYLLRNRGWLAKGSRVIITTRNKHVLILQEVDDLYEVKGLNSKEACELFGLYAFKQNLPKSGFINLSCRVLGYCQGLPLVLKVLGSLLFNKTIPQWEGELNKLDSEPKVKIHNVLKQSYDGLDRTDKNIFLDFACFFKGEDRDFVSRILDGHDFRVESGIRNLNDMCLITIPRNQIYMHDLIQRMGWEIVREKFSIEPNKWSRLWDSHDIERALTTYELVCIYVCLILVIFQRIKGVEIISLDLSKLKTILFKPDVLTKMTKVRLLKVHSCVYYHDFKDVYYHDFRGIREEDYDDIIKNTSEMRLGMNFEFPLYKLRYLYWDGYPLDFLPSNFDGEKLVELHLKCSKIKQLWQGNKYLERLKVIDLSNSRKLIQMSEFSSMPNLERLILNGCVSLIDIHPSVGNMKKLTTLCLRSCDKLKDLSDSIGNLESLEILDLCYCSKFEKFSGKGGNMKSLKELSLEILDVSYCSKFEKFLKKGGNMKSLNELFLINTAIKDSPDSIGDLELLKILYLSDCFEFEKFPEKGGNMKSSKELLLMYTAIKDLLDSNGDLGSLEILDLCSKFEKFPVKGGNMKSLKLLYLRSTAIKDLPNSIGDLESLMILDLSDCSKFEKFPEKGGNMKSLEYLCLQNTAIKYPPTTFLDLWEGLISNQLCNLQKLNITQCKKAGLILVLPSSVKEIDAHHCTSKEDLSGLFWLCHLNWLKSTTEWIRYQNMGSEVIAELPTNWCEDPDFLGFVVSCVYRPILTSDDPGPYHLWVWWYPEIAIPKEHHHKSTHIKASFNNKLMNTKKCGINLIFAGDQQNHMPMLENPQNSGDNGSTLQDTNGNVHGANQDDEHYHIPTLSSREFLEDVMIPLPDIVEEPHYKRLGASNQVHYQPFFIYSNFSPYEIIFEANKLFLYVSLNSFYLFFSII
ncbi:hypothetical protein PVL29_015729 [Vitis rotundifolia]|uniref:ADP-ribosyl cyclase/cyclic ADP-ribose hydrolase n=1 Tax=Vitis rotundifolia TaxID=103349 RepID=A0AA38ZDQ0_VITRO|nr:hypothetical protein PVL29_015729 [Vitis rotundifolia]